MSVNADIDGIDNDNSEFNQGVVNPNEKCEKAPDSVLFKDKYERVTKIFDLKKMQNLTISLPLPDLNPEKIEQIKMEVENGTYTIFTDRIAERLIEEATEEW